MNISGGHTKKGDERQGQPSPPAKQQDVQSCSTATLVFMNVSTIIFICFGLLHMYILTLDTIHLRNTVYAWLCLLHLEMAGGPPGP